MQNDAVVGRVLLASLHQAIAEVLPARLEFYEPWLAPSGPGEQTLGIESFAAMLAFLEQEGELTDAVFSNAGQHAAFRRFAELPTLTRAYLRVLPHQLRAEKVVRLVVEVLPSLYPGSRFDMTRRGGTVFINIDGSPFCGARGPADSPSCGFYAGAVTTFLRLFRLRGSLKVSRCRAAGSKSCLLMVLPRQLRSAPAEGTLLGLGTDAASLPVQPEPPTQPLDVAESLGPSPLDRAVADQAPAAQVEVPVESGATDEAIIGDKPEEPTAALPCIRPLIRDRASVEARWNKIVANQVVDTGTPAAPPGAGPTTPGRIIPERDPEAPWRGL